MTDATKLLATLIFLLDLGIVLPLRADEPASLRSNFQTEKSTTRMSLIADKYSCTPRRTCKHIATCTEANWYLKNCSWGRRLDRDNDGLPCESGPC